MRLSAKDIRETKAGDAIWRDPGEIAWNYSRSETIADLIVHITGLILGVCASAALLALAAIYAAALYIVAISIYALALLSMLTLSAAYNLWPVCPAKWRLRRFDQSAIYVLIAATYTPFAVNAKAGTPALIVLIGVWCVAAVGVAIKFALPGRLDRFSIGLYVAMGWSVVIFWSAKDLPIPAAAFRLLVSGGVLVTLGLIFHMRQKLRFQNAIWHCFVLFGIICQYGAVLTVALNWTQGAS